MAAFSLQIRLLRKRSVRYHAPAGQVNAAGRQWRGPISFRAACSCPRRGGGPAGAAPIPGLLAFSAQLLAAPLAGEGLLGPAPVARLEIEAVLLDVLDDV